VALSAMACLRHLQLTERRAEQVARRGVLDGLVQRAARETERGGADGRAEDIERRHRDLEAFARGAEAIGHRHAAGLEFQRRRAGAGRSRRCAQRRPGRAHRHRP
jgi:hypothetical protein